MLLAVESPTEVCRPAVMSVPAGNVIVIWLPAWRDSPPFGEDVVNEREYWTPAAPGAWLLRVTVGWVTWPPGHDGVGGGGDSGVSDVVLTVSVWGGGGSG